MNKQKQPKPKQPKLTELEEAEARAAEFEAGWKRALADYQNLQKESQEKIQAYAQSAAEAFVQDMLPTVDYFSSAMQSIPEELAENAWTQGIQHIHRQFEELLETRGVKRIPTTGEPFDPMLHEAIEEIEDKQAESGTIVEELLAGYEINGKVLRPARVKTAK